MTDINLQTITPDTTLPTTGFLFGADSQASGSPSVFTVQSVATTLLGSTTLTGATITADAPVLNLAQTWNNAAITFTGLKLNATDTASASGSLLLDIGTGGGTYASKFNVSKAGVVRAGDGTATAPAYSFISQPLTGFYLSSATAIDFAVSNAARIRFGSGATSISVFSDSGSILFGSASDAILTRDTTNTLAQRNGANAQTFRLYGTYTDASNYERARIAWSGNILNIGSEAAGTGTARDLKLVAGSYDMTISATNGQVTVNGAVAALNIIPGATGVIAFGGGGSRSVISSPANSIFLLENTARNDFGRLQFGGTTSLFPALKRNGVGFDVVRADDTAGSFIRVTSVTVANLPAAATAGAGARAFVSDASVPVFGSAVAGGGAVSVPVYSTGAAWNVG